MICWVQQLKLLFQGRAEALKDDRCWVLRVPANDVVWYPPGLVTCPPPPGVSRQKWIIVTGLWLHQWLSLPNYAVQFSMGKCPTSKVLNNQPGHNNLLINITSLDNVDLETTIYWSTVNWSKLGGGDYIDSINQRWRKGFVFSSIDGTSDLLLSLWQLLWRMYSESSESVD